MINNFINQVQRNDGLPQTLCSDCYAKLLNSNNFRVQCFSSDVYLQDILCRQKDYEQVQSVSTEGDIKDFDALLQIDYVVRTVRRNIFISDLHAYAICVHSERN